MPVIDELYIRNGTKRVPVDSINNKAIEEIVVGGQPHHFAKQKDVAGVDSVVCDNAVNEPFRNITATGDTTQQTYKGINLATAQQVYPNYISSPVIRDGRTCIQARGYTQFRLPNGFKEKTQYTVSFDILTELQNSSEAGNPMVFFVKYKDLATSWSRDTITITNHTGEFQRVTLTTLANQTIDYIGPYSNTNRYYNYVDVNSFQFQEGTVATEYEPYVGGTASPNPDYPQEIVNANDNGMNVVLHGDNLFNQDLLLTDNKFIKSTYNGVECLKANGSITIPVDLPAGVYKFSWDVAYPSGYDIYSYAHCEDGTKSAILLYGTVDTSVAEFTHKVNTINAKSKIIKLQFALWNYVDKPLYFRNFMLSAEEEKPYEPYFRQEITIPSSVEVDGSTLPLVMSEYDSLIANTIENKVIYKEGGWQRAMTGTEAWARHGWAYNNGHGEHYILNVDYYYGATPAWNNGYCSHFTRTNYKMPADTNSFSVSQSDKTILIHTDGVTLVADFKLWLQEKYAQGDPIVVLIKRLTPIEHDITNTELGQQLLALAANNGTNHIEITGASSLGVSYWRQVIPNEEI